MGIVKMDRKYGMTLVTNTELREYLMEERRILRDRLATLERSLGLDNKERQLQSRIDELERRIAQNSSLLANGSVSVLR